MKLYEKVVEQIRKDIDKGKYKTGEKIPTEPELMSQYRVGRSTIREAIKTLSITGILNVKQGSGTFVNEAPKNMNIEQRLRRADFDEINVVRILLEKEIVRLAAVNRTEKQLALMEKNLDKRKSAIYNADTAECAEADIAFHMTLAKACGNKVLAELYYSFTLIIRDFFTARETQGINRFAMNHHLHEELFKAVKNGKATAAQHAVQKILDDNY